MQFLHRFLRALGAGALLLAATLAAQGATADGPVRMLTVPKDAATVDTPPTLQIPRGMIAVMRVPVRNYIGRSHEEAQAGLRREALTPELAWKKSSRPKGEVIGQQPSQGELPRRAVVHLEASDGSLVQVPDLRRRDLAAAERAARSAGLDLRAEYREAPATAAGQVLAQKPRAGAEVDRGTVLTVLIAQAARPQPPVLVSVPDVVRMDEARARERLGSVGLRAHSEALASSAPARRVIRQAPANESVPRGTIVTLYVSDGSLVLVPDVQRLDEGAARERLEAAGLGAVRKEQVTDQLAPGVVLAQDPQPRTEVPRHSDVTVAIAAAPPPALVWVPSFVGQQEEEARSALRALDPNGAGPAVEVRSVARHSAAPAQRVIAQRPEKARVRRGSVVTLYVSDASLVVVPEVRQVDEAEAVDRLRAKDLRAVTEQQATDGGVAGHVLAQAPRAGQEVARGSEVRITVAMAVQPIVMPPAGGAAGTTGPPAIGTAGGTGDPGGTGDTGGTGAASDTGGTTTGSSTDTGTGASAPPGPSGPSAPSGDAGALGAGPSSPDESARWLDTLREQPWAWLLAGAAAASAVMWAARALRHRRPAEPEQPKPEVKPAAPKPAARAEWRGPAARPALSSPEGNPVRLAVSVSAPHALERPLARVSQQQEEVSHA